MFSDAQIVSLRLASRPLRLVVDRDRAVVEGGSREAVRRLVGELLEANVAGAIATVPRQRRDAWRVELPASVARSLPFLAWKERTENAAGAARNVRPHVLSSRSRVQLLRRIATYANAWGVPPNLGRPRLVGGRWQFVIPAAWVARMARAERRNAAGQDEGEEDDDFFGDIPDIFCMRGFHPEGLACVMDDPTDPGDDPQDDISCQPPNFIDETGQCRAPEAVPTCGTGFELSGGMCCRIGEVYDPATNTCRKPGGSGGGGGTTSTPPVLPGETPPATPPPPAELGGPATWSDNMKYAVGTVLVLTAAGVGIYLAKRRKKR